MSKINKLITNKPVALTEEEVTNLSKTLSAVQTAGGGGGGGGRVYYGDGTTISVNQIDGIISLTTDATEKLNTPIPTKVSDLTDYEDYQTVDKMSAYLTTAQYNSDSAKFATKTELETTAATFEGLIQSYVQGLASESWVTEQGYLTKPSGDLYYTPLPAGLSDDQYYAMTNSGWKVIQGGGGQGGISTVAHDSSLTGNGNSENLGIKTDAALNLTNASAKSAVSADKANSAINAYSAEFAFYAGTEQKRYNISAKFDTIEYWMNSIEDEIGGLDGASGIKPLKDEYDSTTAFSLTNTAYGAVQYVTANSGKFVTSGDEITGDFQYALTTNGWAKVQAGSTFTGVTTTGSISGGGVNNDTIGLLTSAENALIAVDNKVAKPDTTQESLSNKYLVYSTLTGTGEVTGWTDFNANVYSKTESDGRYQKKEDMGSYLTTAQYETDSATFYTTSNPAGYLNKTVADTYYQPTGSYATSAGLTAGNQYAMTTNGWAVVSTPTIPDITANNGLSANEHTIGIDNTDLVANTQYAWTTTGWTSVETAYLPTSGGTVSGKTTISGSDFYALEILRGGQASTGTIGINGAGGMSLKIADANNNTQLNIAPNATMDKRFSIGDSLYSPAAYLIPAVTATTTAGLTDDGILHIIVEN